MGLFRRIAEAQERIAIAQESLVIVSLRMSNAQEDIEKRMRDRDNGPVDSRLTACENEPVENWDSYSNWERLGFERSFSEGKGRGWSIETLDKDTRIWVFSFFKDGYIDTYYRIYFGSKQPSFCVYEDTINGEGDLKRLFKNWGIEL